MFTKLFWKDVSERLIATEAQVALGLLAADSATSVNAKVWLTTLVVAGAGVLLKALVANKTTNDSVSPASLVEAN